MVPNFVSRCPNVFNSSLLQIYFQTWNAYFLFTRYLSISRSILDRPPTKQTSSIHYTITGFIHSQTITRNNNYEIRNNAKAPTTHKAEAEVTADVNVEAELL